MASGWAVAVGGTDSRSDELPVETERSAGAACATEAVSTLSGVSSFEAIRCGVVVVIIKAVDVGDYRMVVVLVERDGEGLAVAESPSDTVKVKDSVVSLHRSLIALSSGTKM